MINEMVNVPWKYRVFRPGKWILMVHSQEQSLLGEHPAIP